MGGCTRNRHQRPTGRHLARQPLDGVVSSQTRTFHLSNLLLCSYYPTDCMLCAKVLLKVLNVLKVLKVVSSHQHISLEQPATLLLQCYFPMLRVFHFCKELKVPLCSIFHFFKMQHLHTFHSAPVLYCTLGGCSFILIFYCYLQLLLSSTMYDHSSQQSFCSCGV